MMKILKIRKLHFRNVFGRKFKSAVRVFQNHGSVAEIRKLADELVVRTLLKSTGQPDIGLDYRIYRNKAGEWKIVDVNVEGIWMVENYRSQFASVLSQDGIDGLITMLETRTDELAAKNGSAGTK